MASVDSPLAPRAALADAIGVADELLAAIAAVRRAGRRHSGRPVELASLTSAQLELVRVLKHRPRLSVAEAAAELRLAPNTVSTLVGELVDAGLLVRQVDPADRRVARLDLRPDMRRKVQGWRDRRVVALAAAIDGLSPRERRCLIDAVPLLAAIAEGLGMPVAP